MGIPKCYDLLKERASSAIKPYTFSQLRGMRAAVDTNICLYRFAYKSMENPEKSMVGRLGDFYFNTCLRNGIHPVFVIDGDPPAEKDMEREKRKKLKEKEDLDLSEVKLQVEEDKKIDPALLTDLERECREKREKRMQSLLSRPRVSRKNIDVCVEFLVSIGAEVVLASSEGEATCAFLNRIGEVDVVFSEDADVLAYGARYLARGALSNSDDSSPEMKMIDVKKVLECLGLSDDQFLDVCILAGTDFNCGFEIKGIGLGKGYSMVKEHGNIENAVASFNVTNRMIYQEALVKASVPKAGGRFVPAKPRKEDIILSPDFTPDHARKVFRAFRDCVDPSRLIKARLPLSTFNADAVRILMMCKGYSEITAVLKLREWVPKKRSQSPQRSSPKRIRTVTIDGIRKRDDEDEEEGEGGRENKSML